MTENFKPAMDIVVLYHEVLHQQPYAEMANEPSMQACGYNLEALGRDFAGIGLDHNLTRVGQVAALYRACERTYAN